MDETIWEAQADAGRAFVAGGPGVFVSGIVWLVAAAAMHARGIGAGFAVLFLGGMLIFPLSSVICRTIFGRAAISPRNPLGRVALESTIAMIGGLFVAWLFLPLRPEFVFPAAAIAVGTHYTAFRTVYGDFRFWLIALAISAAGLIGIYRLLPPGAVPIAVGVIELLFGILLTASGRRPAVRS